MSIKDIDKFLQQFINKCIQVIIQSRLGDDHPIKTKCNPNGSDWFNLNIVDLKDISDNTQKCMKQLYSLSSSASNSSNNQQQQPQQQSYLIQKQWKICCEILLQNIDNISITLEYWLFSNQPTIGDEFSHLKPSKTAEYTQKIGDIFIRMSTMLKSLIILTRSTPAYRLSSKGQSPDSYVICYRIYPIIDADIEQQLFRNKNSQQPHYSSSKTIGTIRSDFNELSVSFIYRLNMNITSESEIRNLTLKSHDLNENILQSDDENADDDNDDDIQLSMKDDHFKIEPSSRTTSEASAAKLTEPFDLFDVIKPLNPAFASPVAATPLKNDSKDQCDLDFQIPFGSLLTMSKEFDSKSNNNDKHQTNSATKSPITTNPIKIPPSKTVIKSPSTQQIYSTSNDSFVFVELQAPFASEESLLQSFFNGPSPTFLQTNNQQQISSTIQETDYYDDNSIGNHDDIINELSLQLDELESDAKNFDNFIESICIDQSTNDIETSMKSIHAATTTSSTDDELRFET